MATELQGDKALVARPLLRLPLNYCIKYCWFVNVFPHEEQVHRFVSNVLHEVVVGDVDDVGEEDQEPALEQRSDQYG